jgi:hypothetical protein
MIGKGMFIGLLGAGLFSQIIVKEGLSRRMEAQREYMNDFSNRLYNVSLEIVSRKGGDIKGGLEGNIYLIEMMRMGGNEGEWREYLNLSEEYRRLIRAYEETKYEMHVRGWDVK